MPETAWTTADVRKALRVRHNAAAWALLEEVADSTGFAGRFCDAMAMGLWKPRELHGFEIKVSRADWLRELKDPSKAEAFRQFCDRWWLVVSDRAIVRDGELPAGWGLMARDDADALRVLTQAPPLTPVAPTRDFLAALARRMVEQSVDTTVLAAEYERGRQGGWNEAERADHMVKNARRNLRDIRERLKLELRQVERAVPTEEIADA